LINDFQTGNTLYERQWSFTDSDTSGAMGQYCDSGDTDPTIGFYTSDMQRYDPTASDHFGCQSALKIDPPSASKIDPPQSVASLFDPRSDSPTFVSSFDYLAVMRDPVQESRVILPSPNTCGHSPKVRFVVMISDVLS
jgi:hypothetical protein